MKRISILSISIALAASYLLPNSVAVGQSCDDRGENRSPLFSCCGCTQDPGVLFRWPGQSRNATVASLDEPLVTDRPDFTEASSVVGLGVAQFELGYTYIFDDEPGTRAKGQTAPEALLRYGILANWLELRVASTWIDEEVNNVKASGVSDLYLGLKLGLTAQCGLLPEMALVPQMTVPSGGNSVTADRVHYGANLLYSWEVCDCLSVGGSTQVNRATDSGTAASYSEWAQSIAMGVPLGERFGAYGEWFAFFPTSADTERTEHYINGGFTYLICNDIQWDIRSGVGLTDASEDYFVGTGLSIRIR